MNTPENETTEMAEVDSVVENAACPACKAPKGQRCRTLINGVDTGWTHDARVFAYMGVRGDA